MSNLDQLIIQNLNELEKTKRMLTKLYIMHKELCDIHGHPYPEDTYKEVLDIVRDPAKRSNNYDK